jgi:hypothetical protein
VACLCALASQVEPVRNLETIYNVIGSLQVPAKLL